MTFWYLLFAVDMGKEQSKLKPRDLHELTTTTKFSEQEIKVYHKEFPKRSKSGTMTSVNELKKLCSNFFQDGNPSEFAEHIFRIFDQNGDGVLDFHELIVSMAILKKGDDNERLKWAFDIYDIDGNGYITAR
jgi:Ca2+-binding EF-hand superfamily protein